MIIESVYLCKFLTTDGIVICALKLLRKGLFGPYCKLGDTFNLQLNTGDGCKAIA